MTRFSALPELATTPGSGTQRRLLSRPVEGGFVVHGLFGLVADAYARSEVHTSCSAHYTPALRLPHQHDSPHCVRGREFQFWWIRGSSQHNHEEYSTLGHQVNYLGCLTHVQTTERIPKFLAASKCSLAHRFGDQGILWPGIPTIFQGGPFATPSGGLEGLLGYLRPELSRLQASTCRIQQLINAFPHVRNELVASIISPPPLCKLRRVFPKLSSLRVAVLLQPQVLSGAVVWQPGMPPRGSLHFTGCLKDTWASSGIS